MLNDVEERGRRPPELIETRRFNVFRFKRGDERPHTDAFDVPVGSRTTVFEALRWCIVIEPSLCAIHASTLRAGRAGSG